MCPLAQSEGHDAPRLIDQLVPSLAAVVDEIVVGFEDAVGEPVIPSLTDQNRCAHWRNPRDMMRQG
jgi:hypothetical protein